MGEGGSESEADIVVAIVAVLVIVVFVVVVVAREEIVRREREKERIWKLERGRSESNKIHIPPIWHCQHDQHSKDRNQREKERVLG